MDDFEQEFSSLRSRASLSSSTTSSERHSSYSYSSRNVNESNLEEASSLSSRRISSSLAQEASSASSDSRRVGASSVSESITSKIESSLGSSDSARALKGFAATATEFESYKQLSRDDTSSPLQPILEKISRLRSERSESEKSAEQSGEEGSEPRPRTPSFHWYKDGVEFDATDRFQCQFDDEEDSLALVFQKVTPDDAGLYTCVAQTSNGRISCSAELSVHGDIRHLTKTPVPPEVKSNMADVKAAQGTSAMIEANIAAGFPKPQVTWLHDDQEVKADERHKFLENEEDETFALVIKNVQPDDSGEYVVKAKNELGEVETKAKLVVTSSPKFTKSPSSATVGEGEQFKLDISFEGNPVPTVKWFKDGSEITPTSAIRIESKSGKESSLVIDNASVKDAGVYSVTITNESGQQTAVANVAVKSLPKFTRGLKSVECKEDETVEFTVKIDGNVNNVRFLKDGQEVKENDRIKITPGSDGEYKLTINSANSGDVGKYTCVATNENGCQESKANLTIVSKPKFKRSLGDTEARIGDRDVDLTVEVTGSPSADVTWLFNGKPISDSSVSASFEVVKSGDKSSLKIKEITAECEGVYSCIASNNCGSEETSAKLTVIAKPSFRTPLKDIKIELGTKLILETVVEGKPEPSVSWTKDGTEMGATAKISTEKVGQSTKYTLEVTNTTNSDLGKYELKASNCFGSATTIATVTCDSSDTITFKKGLQDKSVLQDETNIELSVELEPTTNKPKVRWFIDDIEIVEEDSRYTRADNDATGSHTLIVKKADEGTAGKYKCVASVDSSESETSSELLVSSKPEFMQGLEDREALEGESISMDIVLAGNPVPQITWLRDGKEITPGGGIAIEKESDLVYILTIDKVSSANTGLYECIISNRVGSSTSKGKLLLMTAPVFRKDLEDASGIEGQIGKLEVVVEGHPRPAVSWYRNGMKIPTTVLSEHPDNMFRLKFDPIEQEDDADYYAEAMNKVGSAKSKTVHYTVNKPKAKELPPQFKQSLRDTAANAGKPLILTCILDGEPKPAIGDIAWFKDGKPVVVDGQRVKMDYNPETGLCTLTINDAREGDLGEYKCVVATSAGKQESKCKVTAGDGFDKPSLKKTLEDVVTTHGQKDLILEVQLDEKVKSECKIRWFLDDTEILSSDTRFKFTHESNYSWKLIICEVDEVRTSGRYKCIVSNSFGSCESSCKVSVNSKPVFIEGLKDKVLEPGDDISLRVRLSGFPSPSVKWYKDGVEITSRDSKFKITYDELSDTHILSNREVSIDDMGQFTCTATNSVGSESSKCSLSAGSGFLKPYFKKGLTDLNVESGTKDLVLSVELAPTKSATEVTWYLNDMEITSADERFSIETYRASNVYKLVIRECLKEHLGVFKCAASNEFGKARTSGRISARPKKDFEVNIPERKPIEREPFDFKSESQ